MLAERVEGVSPSPLSGGRHLLAGRDIVCVSVMDWDWPFWTSRHHLMSEFARAHRVLFVDPPSTFASDYLGAWHTPRLRHKLTRWARAGGVRPIRQNLLVWSPPPVIPFNRTRNRELFLDLLALNQGIFRRGLARTLRRLDIRDPILWVSFNVYFGDAVVGRLGESLSVYHCTDEISGFPGYSRSIAEIEAGLAARCDLVVATSEVLRQAKAVHNPRTYFVPNAADVELFSEALAGNSSEPEDLRNLPHPRAGFVGQIEYRFDGALVRHAAERLPGWSFALIGPVQSGHPEVEALRQLPNVHFLGLKDRSLLPRYLAGLDVALIPYKLDRLTRGIYPLKLHEYLAAGKPVVATPLPSLRALTDRVYLAGDGPAFAGAIQRAAAEDSPEERAQRSRLAQGETWGARAAEISGLMEDNLRKRAREAPVAIASPRRHPGYQNRAASPGPFQASRPPVRAEAPEGGAAVMPLGTFLRVGRQLSRRHRLLPKRLAYRLLGDLNVHRRLRSAHALNLLLGQPLEGSEILDAGCGEGICSFALARTFPGSQVVGVDIDSASVAACQAVAGRWLDRNLRFETADITDLPYTERFAAAVCVDVLEHIWDDEAALRSLYRALKPGGRLIVHVPLRHQLQRRFLPVDERDHAADHVRDEYVLEEIVPKVQDAGFLVECARTTFGWAGELGFELNTLPAAIPTVGKPLAALAFPLALTLGYLDLRARTGSGGNSLLIVARRAGVEQVAP